MPMKSFRGKISDSTVDTISLSTNNGSIGYRIKSLQVMPELAATGDYRSVLKIYTIPQTVASVTNTIDFSDNTLLAAASYSQKADSRQYPDDVIVVFDNTTFNQDIYVTHVNANGNDLNYYIELEQIKLDISENTVATLKDIRNIKSQ